MFSLTRLQTDNTLLIATTAFAQQEQEELNTAKFRAKSKLSYPRTTLLSLTEERYQLHEETLL